MMQVPPLLQTTPTGPWGRWAHRLAAACTLACLTVTTWATNASDPQAYALRIPLTLAPEAPLQRIILPPQALAVLQTSDYRDLRIFNAEGQPVPMAWGTLATPPEQQHITLPAYPILGPALASGTGSGLDGLALRIEEQQGRRIVTLQTDAPATPATPTERQTLGALLDLRTLPAPAVALALDVDLPAGQPVGFTIHSSADLQHWYPLANTVLYRTGSAGDTSSQQLGSSTIDLGATPRQATYLRITWSNPQGGATPPVSLRGATLTTASSSPPQATERPRIRIATPALDNPHNLGFTLPFATPVAAIHIEPQGTNVLVPVRILGRNHPSQPWVPLASGVVYQLQTKDTVQRSSAIALSGPSSGQTWREMRIEADAKTPGFSAPPTISLEWEPRQIVFLVSGSAPFTLAAGLGASAGASNSYLPLHSLIPGYQSGQENSLPLAQAASVAPDTPLPIAAVPGDAPPTRSLVLWGVLLAGVLVLAGMAWALFKQTR